MSALADTSAPAGGPGFLRRRRSSLLIGVALVAAVAVVLVAGTGDSGRTAPLDPANSGADGAQALARVLDGEGVEVEVVRSADDLDDTAITAETTVVVTSAEQLGTSTVARLRERARGVRLVVVDPGPTLLEELGVDGPSAGVSTDGPIPAGCDDPFVGDLEIEVDDATALPTGPVSGCFDDTLVARGDLVLLGAPDVLTNDQVTRSGNAALALRLLGEDERLVWYVASYDDLVADDGVDFWSLVPDWTRPGLGILVLATLGLIGWRGRRLGPLVTEPLPVVVKAIETTRSRGRLYRRAGDRAHAAATLRASARTRARTRLRLGAGSDEHSLVRDVARHVGRPEAEVADLLGSRGRPPASDRDLIALANALSALEEEVRRS